MEYSFSYEGYKEIEQVYSKYLKAKETENWSLIRNLPQGNEAEAEQNWHECDWES